MSARRRALPAALLAAVLFSRPLPAQDEGDDPAASEAETQEAPADGEAKEEGGAPAEEGRTEEPSSTEEPKPDEGPPAEEGETGGKPQAAKEAAPPEKEPGGEAAEPGEEDAQEKPKPKPKAKPKKPEPKKPKAQVPKDAREWEPVAVRLEGDPSKLKTSFLRLVKKVRSRAKEEPPPEGEAKPKPKWVVRFEGERHRANAAARSYKAGEGRILVVSVYPEDLRGGKAHVEARLRLSKADRLEGVEIVAVTVVGAAEGLALDKRDSFILRRRGIHFDESMPARAEARLAALEPWPGAGSRNAGSVSLAEFGDRDLGAVNFAYALASVADGDK